MLGLLSKVGGPWLIYAKIAIAVALCALSFLGGVRWESAASNARMLKLERTLAQEAEAASNRAEQLRQEQAAARQAIETRLVVARRATAKERRESSERIRKMEKVLGACNIDLERERVWRTNNGEAGAGLSDADAAARGGDAGTGVCTDADLFRNHADLVAQYNELTARHVSLQAWARSALATCAPTR